MKWWNLQDWRRRRVLRRHRLPESEWRRVLAEFPVLSVLSTAEAERLSELVVLFLHEKSVQGAGGLELDTEMRLTVAAHACLPILQLGPDAYHGWVSVLVYPTAFWSPQRNVDGAGVVHVGWAARSGEAWDRGPLIVSWDDVVAAAAGDGYNVVIHECAHKLDMLDGTANGLPPLHRDMNTAAWAQAFTTAYDDCQRRLHLGQDTVLEPYAAESPAEFFAVVSETFFELPAVLRDLYPAVYTQLCSFYRQDPALRAVAPGPARPIPHAGNNP